MLCMSRYRDHFVHSPSQWKDTLHCSVVSHWLGACTKWSLDFICILWGYLSGIWAVAIEATLSNWCNTNKIVQKKVMCIRWSDVPAKVILLPFSIFFILGHAGSGEIDVSHWDATLQEYSPCFIGWNRFHVTATPEKRLWSLSRWSGRAVSILHGRHIHERHYVSDHRSLNCLFSTVCLC